MSTEDDRNSQELQAAEANSTDILLALTACRTSELQAAEAEDSRASQNPAQTQALAILLLAIGLLPAFLALAKVVTTSNLFRLLYGLAGLSGLWAIGVMSVLLSQILRRHRIDWKYATIAPLGWLLFVAPLLVFLAFFSCVLVALSADSGQIDSGQIMVSSRFYGFGVFWALVLFILFKRNSATNAESERRRKLRRRANPAKPEA